MNEELKQALAAGDAKSVTPDLYLEKYDSADIRVAMSRAAERVVSHRPGYRDVLLKCIENGWACDIWTAARAGILHHVERALNQDIELLHATDDSGRTALQRAALVYGICKECEEVVDYLISSGATVDIFTASTFGMVDVVKSELSRDASLVHARCEGSTPLNWAVRPRRNYDAAPDICRALMDAGADVSDPDEYESAMTPLHHAAEWGPSICLQLVDLLVASGAEIDKVDNSGWTALDYAKDRKRVAMVDHLSALS